MDWIVAFLFLQELVFIHKTNIEPAGKHVIMYLFLCDSFHVYSLINPILYKPV